VVSLGAAGGLRGVTEVAYWAQARRKFFEAQSSDLMRSTVVPAYVHLLD